MCGITGVFNYLSRAPVDRGELSAMNDTLRHRGPDDAGVFLRAEIGIAMRRLSIVDVEGGHQPISNEDGSVHVVFNGEIYNHELLRLELLTRGHRFSTRSDTEVIVHLYEEYGTSFVERLDGMFAIAIADFRGESPKLVLTRDVWGKKPIYYANDGGVFRFASELKALVRPGHAEIDRTALSHYLSLLFVPAPWTIFSGVRKLEPGTITTVDGSGARHHRTPTPASWIGAQPLTRESVAETRRLLLLAVEKRLTTAVPCGAVRSGGLDSGCVVAIMTALLGERVSTYSIGFEGPSSHDESASARATADYLGTNHHEIRAKPDLLELLPELIATTDEPFAISSSLPLLLLARQASKDLKVVLTGDGGDEVFGGYGQYRYERWAAAWRHLPRAADRLAGSVDERAARFARAARAQTAGERRLRWAAGFLDDEKAELVVDAPPLARTADWLSSFAPPGEPRAESGANAIDIGVFLADEMLCKVDRFTMAASLEARSPLLDDQLARHVLGIDLRARVGVSTTPKRLLVDTVRDWLPPHLLSRRKWGFNVPLHDWFRGPSANYVRNALCSGRPHAMQLLQPAAVVTLVEQHIGGQRNAANRIFALLVLEAWAERWLR